MTCVRGAKGKYDQAILDLYRAGYFKLNPKAGTAIGKNGKPVGSVKRGAKGTTSYVKINLPVLEEPKNGKRSHWCPLHRVMAICFLDLPRGDKNTVNHKDGNGLNNKLSNLEWCTPKQNTQHAIAIGTFSQNGAKNKMALLTDKDVRCILLSKKNEAELAIQYGVGFKTIQAIRLGKTWTHVLKEIENTQEYRQTLIFRSKKKRCVTNLTVKQRDSIIRSKKPIEELAVKYKLSCSYISAMKRANKTPASARSNKHG